MNYGTNWIACKGLATGSQVVADTVNPSRFYAYDSRAGKLLVSTNSAADFSISATTLPAGEGFGAGFGGSGGAGAVLYATPGYEGDLVDSLSRQRALPFRQWRHDLHKSGRSPEANSLGFGKAAPGTKYSFPLYLAGQADQLQAIFRSDDAGQTWVRINDDQHQFGWINHVTGDPRIYGRVYFGTAGRGIIYGDPVPNTK